MLLALPLLLLALTVAATPAPAAASVGGHSYTYDGPFGTRPKGAAPQGEDLSPAKYLRAGQTFYDAYCRVTGKLVYRHNVTDGRAWEVETIGPLSMGLLGGAASYFHLDHLGSRVATSDPAGAVSARERYAPFGEALDAALPNFVLGFTGHSRDQETGLNYMQARYYDPVIGRFLSTDPIGYQDQLNLYAYVHNDPVNKVDPTGECSAIFSGSSTLCGIEDALTRVLTPIVEGAMELAGVDVVPEGERDPGGMTSHTAPEQSAGAEAAAVTAVAAGALVDRMTGGRKGGGDTPASTPTGSRGSPLEVARGTNAPGQVGDREFTGHAFDQMQSRGVPPSAVENTIANGARSPGREAGETVFTDRTNGVRVVTTPTGAVKTVITVDRDK